MSISIQYIDGISVMKCSFAGTNTNSEKVMFFRWPIVNKTKGRLKNTKIEQHNKHQSNESKLGCLFNKNASPT